MTPGLLSSLPSLLSHTYFPALILAVLDTCTFFILAWHLYLMAFWYVRGQQCTKKHLRPQFFLDHWGKLNFLDLLMFVMISENHLYYSYNQENGYAVQRCKYDSRVLKQQRDNKFRKAPGFGISILLQC